MELDKDPPPRANLRHLAALDRLLDTALDTPPYLAALSLSELPQFDDSVLYSQARLAQLRGQWRESLGTIWSHRLSPLFETDGKLLSIRSPLSQSMC